MQTWLEPTSALNLTILAYFASGPDRLEVPLDLPITPGRLAIHDAIIALVSELKRQGPLPVDVALHLLATCTPDLQALVDTSSPIKHSFLRSKRLIEDDPMRFMALVEHGAVTSDSLAHERYIVSAFVALGESSAPQGLEEAVVQFLGPTLHLVTVLRSFEEPRMAFCSGERQITLAKQLLQACEEPDSRPGTVPAAVAEIGNFACVILALMGYKLQDEANIEKSLRLRVMSQARSSHGRLRLMQKFGSLEEFLRNPAPQSLQRRMAQFTRDGTRATRRLDARRDATLQPEATSHG